MAEATAAAATPTSSPRARPPRPSRSRPSNFSFKPDKITAEPGIAEIELTATNGIHDFVFDDAYPGFQLEADGGGSTQSKKIDLKPGTYDFYCSITGHRAAGMEGTLTVK